MTIDGNGGADCVLRGVGLAKAFAGNSLFKSLDIELRAGEMVLLRGDNGAGKSTLIDLLSGNQRADAGWLEVRTAGGGARRLDARRVDPVGLARLGVVKCWQRPELFWSQTVGENLRIAACGGEDSALRVLARSLLRRRRDGTDRGADLDRFVGALGLGPLIERGATALSFGQTRRASIALSAVVGGQALLLDEPLASLDRDAVAAVKELLRELVEVQRRAVLVVEHALNERLLAGLDYRVVELRCGRLVAGERRDAGAEVQPPVEAWRATLASAAGLHLAGGAEALGDGAVLLRFGGGAATDAPPALALEGLRVERGGWPLFSRERGQGDGLSLAIGAGEVALLLARNGWGKSSLAKAVAGEVAVAAGRVRLSGLDVTALPVWARRRRGLLYSETANALFGSLSVADTLALKHSAGADGLGLAPRREVRTLSGGERQRLALHCALGAAHGRVLVLDEPFNGLDRAAATEWLQRFVAAARQGAALLICLPA